MGRRGRKKSPFKIKLRVETLYSLGSLLFFAVAGLITVSFSGQGQSLQEVNMVLRENFGVASLILPFVCVSAGLVLTGAKWSFAKPQVLLGSFFFFLSTLVLLQSGAMGITLFSNFADLIQPLGTRILFALLGVAGFMIFTDTSLREIFAFLTSMLEVDHSEKDTKAESKKKADKELADEIAAGKPSLLTRLTGKMAGAAAAVEPAPQSFVVNEAKSQTHAEPELPILPHTDGPTLNQPSQQVWEFPPLTLLSSKKGKPADRGDINKNAQIIEDTLTSFNIQAKIVEVNCGPAVTQYALQLSTGIKLSKVTGLANDLALALAAPTGQIRIEAPIPGKSLVGIEIPNRSLEVVTLRTMLTSKAMANAKSKLAVSLGLNVSGEPVVGDITKFPHCLIAGSTGSGKSVAVNSFICSILFRASPQEVQFLMIDPKRVELSVYNDIPHLKMPVVTDAKKAAQLLRWACDEMDKRYKLLAQVGVRNIAGYNEMAGFSSLPYYIIMIDELADLMLLAPSEVEQSIVRLAQMARAVGIHLVLATQRPSVDVITGLIKANIPTRIAFNVASNTDSRVILDGPGAEKLLGRGDMLYIPPDEAKPRRIQGTFVSDEEVQSLIQFLRQQGEQPDTQQLSLTDLEKYATSGNGSGGGMGGDGETDEFFDESVRIVLESGKGSASYIQRRLSVGYNRAARILDQLSEQGIVGPSQGSKPREVNKTAATEYLTRKGAEPTA
jgi:S-DNA-T family DNA segregation ATPase FtsK/SpoIIIE